MKKFFKGKIFMLLAIFMLPLLVLTACDETKYFRVTATVNDSNRGNVSPNSRSIAEGSEHTISASETNGEFICWIKDSITIVSTEKDYTFVVNEQTAGNYTGVFTQSDPSMMMYVALTKISISSPASVNQIAVTIKMAAATSYTIRRQIYIGNLQNNTTPTILNRNAFSFLSADQYSFFVTLTYTDNNGQHSDEFEILLYGDRTDPNYSFTNEDGSATVGDNNKIVSLTFEKLSKELVSQIKD